jgi:hypothetical protein
MVNTQKGVATTQKTASGAWPIQATTDTIGRTWGFKRVWHRSTAPVSVMKGVVKMVRRSGPVAGITLFLVLYLAGWLHAQSTVTPFSFIHRNDVREEVNVSQTQINRVDQLQVHCEALCQQRMRAAIDSMDPDLQQQFEQLDVAQQERSVNALEQDMLETVQLEALDQQVLDEPQMDRFSQLWTQQNGLDSLTCGPTSRQLGMSGFQISQIQALRNDAISAMQACTQDSQLSAQQQLVQIQNIQVNLINQCVNVLSDEQIQEFANMCGDPFAPEPLDQEPMDGSDGSHRPGSDAESQNSDDVTSVDNLASGVAEQAIANQEQDLSRNDGRARLRNVRDPRR